MAIYAITWQKNSLQPHPEEQERKIIERLKTLPHYNDPDLTHVWFVATDWRADRLHRYLYKEFEAPDGYLILQMTNVSGYAGYGYRLSNKFDEWAKENKFVKIGLRLDWEAPKGK